MTITQTGWGHGTSEDQIRSAPAILDDSQSSSATPSTSAVAILPASHECRDSHGRSAGGNQPTEIQSAAGPHTCSDLGSLFRDHMTPASHVRVVADPVLAAIPFSGTKAMTLPDQSSPESNDEPHPMSEATRGPLLFNPLLCLLADSLDDLESLRIATDNRLRMLTRAEADSDGEYRGLGLDDRSPQVRRVATMAEGIWALEHQASLDLQRELRASPFYPWVLRQKGVGAKQAARLLAAIGDPYWNDLHDRPRTVSELWAYCGYAVTAGRAQRRQKGVKANWNDTAKMRVFLMAESCVKSLGGYYRSVYDAARAQYVGALHPHDCVRCGPSGRPALAGTPLSAGHQHARALRRVAKEILRDLWIEARAIHESEDE